VECVDRYTRSSTFSMSAVSEVKCPQFDCGLHLILCERIQEQTIFYQHHIHDVDDFGVTARPWIAQNLLRELAHFITPSP
jgi:hypothetical protein